MNIIETRAFSNMVKKRPRPRSRINPKVLFSIVSNLDQRNRIYKLNTTMNII